MNTSTFALICIIIIIAIAYWTRWDPYTYETIGLNCSREQFNPAAYGPAPLHHRTTGAGDNDDDDD